MPNRTGGKGKGKGQSNSGAGNRTKRVSQGKNSARRSSSGSQAGSFSRAPTRQINS
jgi:hypothetical protein